MRYYLEAMEKKHNIDIFSLLALLIILMVALIGHRVFFERNYPVFTDEEQLEESVIDEFGPFSEYLL